MILVTPIPAFTDNYLWAIHNEKHAVIVDPGDAEVIEHWLGSSHKTLSAIVLTHHHYDHIGGVEALKRHRNIPVYGPADIECVTHAVSDGDTVVLDSLPLTFNVIATPGHTLNHLCYFNEHWLFCGDTLFVGGCGKLFEGTPAQMLESFQHLQQLPHRLKVFCAHEYTLTNLRFALEVDPHNVDLQDFYNAMLTVREHNQPTVPSTLAQELRINPYFTCINEQHRHTMNIPKLAQSTALDAFAYIRQQKDHWSALC